MGQVNCQTSWKEKLNFEADMRGHKVNMDTKIEFGGQNQGPTPKELLLASISGCSAMDVISILQKMRLTIDSFDVKSEAETTPGHPAIFKEILVQFRVKSSDAKPEQVVKAVTLSMTKYCGVSAMVCPTSPIVFEVFLNEEQVGSGRADFAVQEVKA